MEKNQIYELTVEDVNNLGNGIAHLNGKTVFIPRGVDGDRLSVKLIKITENYIIGRIESILSPSPHRQEPDCQAARRCGGCVFRHITYAHELELKQSYVKTAFRKAGLSVTVAPTLSGQPSGYRNKVQYPIGDGISIGFYAPRSHQIVPCIDCDLQDRAFTPIIAEIRQYLTKKKIGVYNEETHRGLLRHIYLRRGKVSGEIMVCLVTSAAYFPEGQDFARYIQSKFPEVTSVIQNVNPARTNVILGDRCITLAGSDSLTDTLCGLRFRLSPLSFYQINHDMAEVLYRKATELADLRPGDQVADLFCGAGTIGLSVAAMHPDIRLTGIEIIPEAVENAKENARLNGISNAHFICGNANAPELMSCDVIFLDPPRKGCEAALIEKIASIAPRKVVYISCNPDTLARDAARFVALGYTPSTIYPVDLFPRTGHVECVVLMSRIPD